MKGKTIAQALMEKGYKEGYKQGRKEGAILARHRILLRVLRLRFGELRVSIVATIKATRDLKQLDEWVVRGFSVATLAEVGIK